MADQAELIGQPTILSIYTVQIEMNAKLDMLLRTDADHETRIRALEQAEPDAELKARLLALERAKWPLPSIAAVAGVAGVVTGVIGLYR